ncbi:MAG: DUF3784 domain-containing protein [Oscillospiraceae bacterium]
MDKIMTCFVAILSVLSFIVAYFQLNEKGFLLNNAYLWASTKERQTMDKKPHYRQSAIVFCGIGILFMLLTVEMIVKSGWLNYIVLGIVALLIVYAIVSSIVIGKKHQ